MTSGIYSIVCSVSGKRYVGSCCRNGYNVCPTASGPIGRARSLQCVRGNYKLQESEAQKDHKPERYLKVREVAECLGVDEGTVRCLIHEQGLRATRPGKEYRIKRSWLEDFMREHEVSE